MSVVHQPPPVVQRKAVAANFAGVATTSAAAAATTVSATQQQQQQQQILTTDGSTNLQLLQIDANGVYKFAECCLSKLILGAERLRVPNSQKDYILAALEGGEILILEFHPSTVQFQLVDKEGYQNTDTQWMHWGKTMAVDHRGRLVIVGNVEDYKIVYISVDTSGAKLMVSLPMVDALENTIIYSVVSVELPKGNPVFACLEAYQDVCEGIPREDIISMGEKMLVYFEFDLESNEVFRRWDVRVERTANLILPVPGDPGPAGVLVCSRNTITWYHERHGTQRLPIPRHPGLSVDDDIYIISYITLRLDNGAFLIFVHSTYGDIYRIHFEYSGNQVVAMYIRYFDSAPLAEQILMLQNQYIVALSSVGEPKCYMVTTFVDDEPDQPTFSSAYEIPREQAVYLHRNARYMIAMDSAVLYAQPHVFSANFVGHAPGQQYQFVTPAAAGAYAVRYANAAAAYQGQAAMQQQYRQAQSQQQQLMAQAYSLNPAAAMYPMQAATSVYTPGSGAGRKSSLTYRQAGGVAGALANRQMSVSQRSTSLRRANTLANTQPAVDGHSGDPNQTMLMGSAPNASFRIHPFQQHQFVAAPPPQQQQQQPQARPRYQQQPTFQFATPMQISKRNSSLRRPARSQPARAGSPADAPAMQDMHASQHPAQSRLGTTPPTKAVVVPTTRISPAQLSQRASSLSKPSRASITPSLVSIQPSTTSVYSEASDVTLAIPELDEQQPEADDTRQQQQQQSDSQASSTAPLDEAAQKRLKQMETRKYIAYELLDTEKNYAQNLRILDTHFRKPFQQVVKTDEQIVPPIFIRIVFTYVSELLEFSEKLAKELEDIIDAWDETTMLGSHFLDKAKDFTLFLKYVDNYSTSHSMIRRAEESNVAFRQFNEKCRNSRETNRQELKDFLILPIQRVTRYSLLLKDLKKHTPPEHPDYADLEQALMQMNEVAAQVNKVKQQEEEMTRMFTIYKLVEQCPPNIIKYTRRVILEVDVTEAKSSKQLRLFLLSDLMMIARISRGKLVGQRVPKFKFTRLIDLADIDETLEVGTVVAFFYTSINEGNVPGILTAADRAADAKSKQKQSDKTLSLSLRPNSLSSTTSTLVARSGAGANGVAQLASAGSQQQANDTPTTPHSTFAALSHFSITDKVVPLASSSSSSSNEDLPLSYTFQFADAKAKQDFELALRAKIKTTIELREKENNPTLPRASTLPSSPPHAPPLPVRSHPSSLPFTVQEEDEDAGAGAEEDETMMQFGDGETVLGEDRNAVTADVDDKDTVVNSVVSQQRDTNDHLSVEPAAVPSTRTKSQEHVSLTEFLADNDAFHKLHGTQSTHSLPNLPLVRSTSDSSRALDDEQGKQQQRQNHIRRSSSLTDKPSIELSTDIPEGFSRMSIPEELLARMSIHSTTTTDEDRNRERRRSSGWSRTLSTDGLIRPSSTDAADKAQDDGNATGSSRGAERRSRTASGSIHSIASAVMSSLSDAVNRSSNSGGSSGNSPNGVSDPDGYAHQDDDAQNHSRMLPSRNDSNSSTTTNASSSASSANAKHGDAGDKKTAAAAAAGGGWSWVMKKARRDPHGRTKSSDGSL
ncbi:hypothetical protein RI367_000986 [Sorochytrium milnesiophthora]